jgi:small subunit ribosomal protein S5
MTDTNTKEEVIKDATVATGAMTTPVAPDAGTQDRKPFVRKPFGQQGRGGYGAGRPGGRPGGKPGFGGARDGMEQKVLSIRRVARVIAGGKRFTFSVCLVLGDKKGSVGVGLAKAGGTSEAIEKATRDAKKNMVKVNTTKSMSIHHETRAKYCSGIVDLRPAPGRGLIAGSAPRVVLALAGITDINAKIISGSKNKINNARATWMALKSLSK